MENLKTDSEERHEQLFDIVRTVGEIKISDLAEQLHVTPRTIRRDVSKMRSLDEYKSRIDTRLGRNGSVYYIRNPDSSARFLSEKQKEILGVWALLTIKQLPEKLQKYIEIILKRLGVKPVREVPEWLHGIKSVITG